MARVGDSDRRVRLALTGVLLVFALFAARLLQLQGVDADALAAQALKSRFIEHELPAHRADIVDTTGAVLASTVERRNIAVDQQVVRAYNARRTDLPPRQRGVAGAALALEPVLHLGLPRLEELLTGRDRFVYLVKDVEPTVWAAASRTGVPGLVSEQVSRRTYPNARVAASVLGFVGKDGTALSGMEKSQDELLRGVNGRIGYERGSGGQEIATGSGLKTAPVPGRTLKLTIDRDLTWRAQQALDAGLRATGARAAYAVVLDPRTFDVLAMVDAPTFDAGAPGRSPEGNRQNRALLDVFEPGSTSKVITAAAALQEGVATPATRLTIPGRLRRGGEDFHDSHAHGPEKLTLAGVLAKSSNIGAIRIGERLPPAVVHDYMVRFGLGRPTGVGLPESTGILAPAKDWNASQRYTVLFGQGLSVTALQAAGVFATVANDGVRRTPRLVEAVGGTDGRLHDRPLGKATRVISTRNAKRLRLMLESVVGDDGTAVRAAVPGYRVAGKTGTADYYSDALKRYDGYTASFVGMAPADKPRLVVAVFLQQPSRAYYGGTAAAPVFQEIMTYALRKAGVPPSSTTAPRVSLTWR